MNKKKIQAGIQEKVILNSLGFLNEEDEEFKFALESSPADKRMMSEFNNLVSLFPKLIEKVHNNVSPSEKVKEKIFEKIRAKEIASRSTREKNFDFVYASDSEWLQHPVEGIKFRQLALNEEKGYVMILMKVAAGTKYPPHHHTGAEECYVIEGDLFTEGKTLGPGDFHHADGGSDHEPLYTKNGCTVILVVDPGDYK